MLAVPRAPQTGQQHNNPEIVGRNELVVIYYHYNHYLSLLPDESINNDALQSLPDSPHRSATYTQTMPLRQVIERLANKAEQAIDERREGAPPIPYASKPLSADFHHYAPYWQPIFQPSGPVSASFHHEQGNWGWGNNEAQNYTDSPANSFHTSSNGLVVRAIVDSTNSDPKKKYTSARLSSHARLSKARGCLSARITAPVATGIWPAFWLLPHDPFQWPTDGEVDIFEAWDGQRTNHSCLHWGHFNGQDWNKHRVIETAIPGIDHPQGVKFDFVWNEDKMLWCIDGNAVMKASRPAGARPMTDFRILINIAVGGNVCQGHMPRDGTYDLHVRELCLSDVPPSGWEGFDRDWARVKEGKTM